MGRGAIQSVREDYFDLIMVESVIFDKGVGYISPVRRQIFDGILIRMI